MKKKNIILAAILVLLCIGAAGISAHFHQAPIAGAKEIDILVLHADQTEHTFTYQTDAEYLADVLLENELAEGEMGPYGLFITTVDGETADESKQQWWCITKGGAQVNSGAEELPLADGDQFELTLTEGY